MVRAAFWVICIGAPALAYNYAMAPVVEASQGTPLGSALGFSVPLLSLTLTLAMFITARRGNGYAGLHDLATGTRVVLKRTSEGRARAALQAADQPRSHGSLRTGPYVILDERPLGGDRIQVGYDDRLRRRVWIRRIGNKEPHLPAERQILSRSTRLRWLSGRRTDHEAWDAYEAADGQPLLSMLGRPHPWSTVRLWILDLAMEIRAGLAEGYLPPLALDQVWITKTGRVILLDWPAEPSIPTPPGEPSLRQAHESARPDFANAQAFLYEVGVQALDPVGARQTRHLQIPLPIGARSLFDRLEHGSFGDADALVAEAAALARDPATVRRGRRIGHLAFCCLPQVLWMLLLAGYMSFILPTRMSNPALNELKDCLLQLERLSGLPGEAEKIRAFELYVAGIYRARVEDPATWSQRWSILRGPPRLQAVARRALAAHPNPTTADLLAAETVVRPHLEQEKVDLERLLSPFGIIELLLLFGTVGSVGTAGIGLLSALIFRGGLALRLFGAVVVTSRGNDVSRLRALGRALAAWSPAALGAVGLAIAPERFMTGQFWMIPAVSSMAFLLIGAVYAALHPDRGIQDLLAGTRLVPQ
jgi:eukaryotic-like serine/threonine-protein kinase